MAEPVLSIKHLHKRFGALLACDDVSLDLQVGEIHALIGPNGAGKSTLIRQITGYLRHDAGHIRLGGRDIGGLGMVQRVRAGIAQSFQVSSVIPRYTALQNVMLAAQGQSGSTFRFFRKASRQPALIDRAREVLETLSLADRESMLAAELSHGERRKLELAMALALQPQIFVLDEPMAGVGSAGSREMTELLARLKHQAPILLVEHDMDAVFALADRISVLVNGRLIATGSVDGIRADPEVRAAYMGVDEDSDQ